MRFEGMGFGFGREPLFEGLSLEVEEGGITALVGPSGCGKSTLLRLAAGLLRPDSGAVETGLGGAPGECAFVFQAPTLLPWRSLAANVGLPLELAGQSAPERRGAVEAALVAVGLLEHAHKLPRELSGGMQMRASLARAWVTRPRLLLMDEPFSSLDALSRGSAWERFLELWERDRPTVLLVTHDIDEAVLLSDRVVVLGAAEGGTVGVREQVPVDLPRPRHPGLRHDPGLGALAQAIEGLL